MTVSFLSTFFSSQELLCKAAENFYVVQNHHRHAAVKPYAAVIGWRQSRLDVIRRRKHPSKQSAQVLTSCRSHSRRHLAEVVQMKWQPVLFPGDWDHFLSIYIWGVFFIYFFSNLFKKIVLEHQFENQTGRKNFIPITLECFFFFFFIRLPHSNTLNGYNKRTVWTLETFHTPCRGEMCQFAQLPQFSQFSIKLPWKSIKIVFCAQSEFALKAFSGDDVLDDGWGKGRRSF